MLDYCTIGYNDADAKLKFYDAVFGAIGLTRAFFNNGWAGYGPEGAKTQNIYLCKPTDGNPANFGNGMMLAFRAPSQDAVRAAHAAALANGGSDEGAPGPRPADSTTYFGSYMRDPTGNKIAIFWRA
jgi:catechol 2,3-dioxygenase-like lactoylglutathione lyase family enzyme